MREFKVMVLKHLTMLKNFKHKHKKIETQELANPKFLKKAKKKSLIATLVLIKMLCKDLSMLLKENN